MKTLIILRSVSGSGKSTCAEVIKALNPSSVKVCCADDYFVDADGNYNFDASKLYAAHRECQINAKEAMECGYEMVIIANTNTKPKEFKVYEQYAKANSYMVITMILENRHGGKNVHNVPEDVLTRQENALSMNLKLT
jgi:predicted kinase